ncbi:MAG: hypothetical protein ACRD68_14470, partial [Pyrinomonadaceae bacterium]
MLNSPTAARARRSSENVFPERRFVILFACLLSLLTTSAVSRAATIRVAAGGDFQAALYAAHPGDTILLEAGATFVGPFTLPYKPGTGTDWITIRSSAPDADLPAPGERVTPAHSPRLPKLVIPSHSGPAVRAAVR